MLHDEVDGIAALAARKALADAARGRNVERRRALVVKRAQSFVVGTALLERYKLRYHVHNVRGIHDPVYGCAVYHI